MLREILFQNMCYNIEKKVMEWNYLDILLLQSSSNETFVFDLRISLYIFAFSFAMYYRRALGMNNLYYNTTEKCFPLFSL